ncbi:hypothetical protein A1O3_06211 [Capronia epimyces CBS 606.96]|uniref:Uncharacterized protein n=1 Tax=Capronia epimyces CBS 606.96 TaxID=1182542 RepID=W9XQC8_9EURO|nr:uncharacterized protein A1O3_06211 [Capronia epimyces CBS 606.96]EXJ82398.1 hypothetical protein A1O3_06211 [Capronia epimyces CBS 606.96]
MAAPAPSSAGIVHPDDRQIVEKLAKLQDMYQQIGALRTLLPEKLINPTRFALDNPDGYDPEKLAAFLQGAAQAGSRDIGKFKRDWHSENVRGLWHTVNTNELPQGADAWTVDYELLARETGAKDDRKAAINAADDQFQLPTQADTAKIVNDFRARYPALKIKVSNEVDILPIDLNVAHLDFCVDRDQTSGNAQYTVKGRPTNQPSLLRDEIVKTIHASDGATGLADILDILAAYRDIKTRPCDKCSKLFSNTKLQLPLIRRLKTGVGEKEPQFVALHRDCA